MKLLLKFTGWSISFLKKSYNFCDALLSGFWLGVLSKESIEEYNDLHYDTGSTYINDIYNLSGLQRWEYDMLKKHFPKAHSFLVIGAGGGRETLALAKWNRNVDSYECSKTLVEYANEFLRRNNAAASVRYLPKNNIPDTAKQYDGIIFGWGAYSHIQGRSSRISFLTGILPFCNEDTHLMISFLVREGQPARDKIIKNISNFFRIPLGRERTEQGDRLLSYFAHFFNKEEIEKEVTSAGYTLVEYSDVEYGCAVLSPGVMSPGVTGPGVMSPGVTGLA